MLGNLEQRDGPVLVRHGEKLVGPGADRVDPPLSERGRVQAAALAEELAGERFEELYTSPRLRARQTAQILGEKLGLEPVVCHELRNVPNGPLSLLSLFEVPPFGRRVLAGRCLVVTHGGTMLVLLATLGLWRQALRRPQGVPQCWPFACPPSAVPGFGGPLALMLAGMLIALLAAPGDWPGLLAAGSMTAALLVYGLAARLARRGKGAWMAAALVLAALALAPLAFGPSMQNNRKVLPFNAWAYELGAYLPALPTPPPNPNGVAAVLVAGIGLAGAAAGASRERKRALALAALALLGAGLLLTASRAGWLAGAAALIFLARGRLLRYARLLAAPMGIVLLLAIPVLGYAEPGQPALISPASMFMRAQQWERTFELLEQHPATGLGPGRFAPAYAASASAAGQRPYKTPNNTLLELWADAGLLGLAAAGWATLRAVRLARAARRANPAGAWLLDGLLAALIAFAVHGLFETNTAIVWSSSGGFGYLASPLPFALLGLLAGLGAAQTNRRDAENAEGDA